MLALRQRHERAVLPFGALSAQGDQLPHLLPQTRGPAGAVPVEAAAVVGVSAAFQAGFVTVVDAGHTGPGELQREGQAQQGQRARRVAAAQFGQQARRVVAVEQVELSKLVGKGDRCDRPRQRRHQRCSRQPRGKRRDRTVANPARQPETQTRQPALYRQGEAVVVHGAVFLIALQPARGLGEVLAQHVGVGPCLADGLAHRAHVRRVVPSAGPFAEHVDHVQPPAVHRPRRFQPARQQRILCTVDGLLHAAVGEVQHRQGGVSFPAQHRAIGLAGITFG